MGKKLDCWVLGSKIGILSVGQRKISLKFLGRKLRSKPSKSKRMIMQRQELYRGNGKAWGVSGHISWCWSKGRDFSKLRDSWASSRFGARSLSWENSFTRSFSL